MKFALFDASGMPQGFYADDVQGPRLLDDGTPNPAYPDGVVEITDEQWLDLISNQGARRWVDGTVVAFEPPAPPPTPVYIQKVDIWRRATDAEAEKLVALLGQQSIRLQRMFSDATVISSADEMWPTLLGGITQLLGADRAKALLAPS